jgi:hypothetical protein
VPEWGSIMARAVTAVRGVRDESVAERDSGCLRSIPARTRIAWTASAHVPEGGLG